MIFKHLFTPKWKHPKLSIRLGAVEKLNISDEKDAIILDGLAFSDDAVEVRKEALNKLNDIAIWYKAFKKDQSQGIKELAEQHVSKAVLKSDKSLPAEIKSEYIEICNKNTLLEKLALEDKCQTLRVKLLKRLAKPNLIETAFKQGDETFQLAIFDLIEQYKLLKVCQNKALGSVSSKIEYSLTQQKLAKEMPIVVEKEVKLILAKLNALREKTDYELVKTQSEVLSKNWQALELKWLTVEQLNTASVKYLALETKLEIVLARLEHEHNEKLALIATKAKAKAALEHFNGLINKIDEQLSISLLTPSEESTEKLLKQLTNAQHEINEHTPKLAEHGNLQNALDRFSKQIKTLPELIRCSEEFNEQLEMFSTLTIPTDVAQYDDSLTAFLQWQKTIKSLLPKMPAPVKQASLSAFNSLAIQWKDESKELKNTLENAKKQSQKKLRDLKRLLDQGRYNIAFGVFKGMDEIFQTLTPNYKINLLNDYEQIQGALTKAQEWQQYVAEPKRDEIIIELKELILLECEDAKERAGQVKLFRKRWNELGRINSDDAKLKANEFDLLLEQAFSPCRAFFAEQEAQRQTHLIERELIIEKMVALGCLPTESISEFKALETEYNKLSKSWRQAGSVDSQVYQGLLNNYKSAEKAIVTQIKAKHKSNAELKTTLLEQATLLTANEDIAQACDQLKQLQDQWKQIGFAGNKAENDLWQAFRKCNDDVFSQRETVKQQQEKQINAQSIELEENLNALTTQFSEVPSTKLNVLLKEVNAFSFQVPHSLKAIKLKASDLADKIAEKISELVNEAKLDQFKTLFNSLENEHIVPVSWLKTVKGITLTRAQLTVRMEILAQIETPASDAKLKMDEQIAMLSEKMLGEHNKLNDLLEQWINVSDFTKQDVIFVKRIKPIFTT